MSETPNQLRREGFFMGLWIGLMIGFAGTFLLMAEYWR